MCEPRALVSEVPYYWPGQDCESWVRNTLDIPVLANGSQVRRQLSQKKFCGRITLQLVCVVVNRSLMCNGQANIHRNSWNIIGFIAISENMCPKDMGGTNRYRLPEFNSPKRVLLRASHGRCMRRCDASLGMLTHRLVTKGKWLVDTRGPLSG